MSTQQSAAAMTRPREILGIGEAEERAVPLSLIRGGALETGDPGSRFPETTEKLLWLMAAGPDDKKIADELRISESTLKRRIAQLMQTFNARTRFQLGRPTEQSFPGQHGKRG